MHCIHGCRETVRLIKRLHQYDVMRANKAPFAFGLEPRVPFLDKEFLDVSMTLDPADKMVRSCSDLKSLCTYVKNHRLRLTKGLSSLLKSQLT